MDNLNYVNHPDIALIEKSTDCEKYKRHAVNRCSFLILRGYEESWSVKRVFQDIYYME